MSSYSVCAAFSRDDVCDIKRRHTEKLFCVNFLPLRNFKTLHFGGVLLMYVEVFFLDTLLRMCTFEFAEGALRH